MKRVRCPKCDKFIIFDETRYKEGQSLVFQCPDCGKQFGIRIGVSKLNKTRKEERKDDEEAKAQGKSFVADEEQEEQFVGCVVIIENMFHFKQVLPLKMGDNIIGKYAKGNEIQIAVETSDPSIDLHHCVLNVSRDKKGELKYILRDGPSYTGTFVGDTILGDRERRVIYDGTLFTMGATTAILKLKEE